MSDDTLAIPLSSLDDAVCHLIGIRIGMRNGYPVKMDDVLALNADLARVTIPLLAVADADAGR